VGRVICRQCLEYEGVVSTSVIEHRCMNERTERPFTAFVCARCLDNGRETRVTCRTFKPIIDRRGLSLPTR
jgi:hypothetical protein